MSIGLADTDAHRSDDPRSAFYVVDAVTRGNTFERTLRVTNTTTESVTVALYIGDAAIVDRRFAFDVAPEDDGVSGWSQVSPAQLTIAPGTSEHASVVITPPSDLTAGERYGVIWAELPRSGGNAGVVVNRVGVRIYLAVGSETSFTNDLTVDQLTAIRDPDGRAVVAVNITNTGTRALDLSGTVDLARESGTASAQLDPGTVLPPGDSGEALARFDGDLADGPWDATVSVSGNGVERRGTATISFPAEPDRRARPVVVEAVGNDSSAAAPLVALAVALTGLVLAALVVRARASVGRRDSLS